MYELHLSVDDLLTLSVCYVRLKVLIMCTVGGSRVYGDGLCIREAKTLYSGIA